MIEGVSGEDFYTLLAEMGERVVFLSESEEDEPIYQFASITPHRTTNTTDGAYWYTGNITFDNLEQQTDLLGRYFVRQTNPNPHYILTAVMPENLTPKLGIIYCVECNEIVDIISHYNETGEFNEFGEAIKEPIFIAKDVKAYSTKTVKQTKTTDEGALVETVTNLLLPAKYKISNKTTFLIGEIVFNSSTKMNEYKKIEYEIESIDTSMAYITEEKINGIIRCMLKERRN